MSESLPDQRNNGGLARDLSIVFLLAAVVLVPSLTTRDLWTPDEPRYMEVAREMAETGDYVVPHLNGALYPDKPPLFFWLAAGLYKLGLGYNSGRIVAALAAVCTLVMTYMLARRMMPRPGPVIAVLAVLVVPLFVEAKAGVIDPLLMCMTTLAIFCGFRALQPETRAATRWWLGAYAFSGLAVLTKGPVGLVVPLLVLAGYGLVNRRRVRGGGWAHLIGAVLLLAIALAWFIPMLHQAGPDYRQEVYHQVLGRVAESYSHRQPFYYFLEIYPITFVPWMFIFPIAFVAAISAWRRTRDHNVGLMLLWFSLVFVFFSIMSGKRQGYLMPLLPAAGLLVGWYVSTGLRDGFKWGRAFDVLSRVTFGVYLAAAAAMTVLLFELPQLLRLFNIPGGESPEVQSLAEFPQWLRLTGLAAAAMLLLVALFGIWLIGRQRRLGAFVCAAGGMLALLLFLDLAFVPRINELKSARGFCEAIEPYLAEAHEIHLLRNDMSGMYNLYTGRICMAVVGQIKTDPYAQAGQEKRMAREKAFRDAFRETLATLASEHKVAIIARRSSRELLLGPDMAGYFNAYSDPVGSREMELLLNWNPETETRIPPPKAKRVEELIEAAIERERERQKKKGADTGE